jgi:uncharacterized membrane protein YqaE (UPF0057 family)
MSTSIFDAIMYGGLIAQDICFPSYIFKLIVTIIFPPLGVWWNQHELGYPAPGRIALGFILTALFYFPGLIYALNDHKCGSTKGMNTSHSSSNNTSAGEDNARYADGA